MAASLVPSAMVSIVSGLEFTIASTCIIKVFRASSFKLDPWVLCSDPKTALADLNFVLPNSTKVTPSWWILLPNYPITTRILQEFCSSASSFSAPMKLLPLSDLSILAFPRHPINLKHVMKESVHWIHNFKVYGLTSEACKGSTIAL